ncbi:uncharacterized protein LOC116402243 [Cucumis sativus]|uniref:uncharacterized protein LOC116402243 n=1 Tax=Cucumis sativus TaxID=3659 RepID=UPI0012F4D622|nr:uncharacterized protein LOC116402243 [Cucumis sativus]KAE8651668.1 hypothetical protein Csa_021345 [Cucumis sativus]
MEGKLCHWDMKNKVISRTSSIGYSSHSIYYSGTADQGVPFKWETQPGTPKDPPPQDLLPPLSPPPAVLSLGVPKPYIDQPKSRPLPRMRLRFWKKIMKSRDGGKAAAQTTTIDHYNDKLETFSFLSSDCEFMASPSPQSSMSSSSTSSSSSSPSSFLDSLNVRNMRKVSFGRPSSWNNAWQINKMLACYHS